MTNEEQTQLTVLVENWGNEGYSISVGRDGMFYVLPVEGEQDMRTFRFDSMAKAYTAIDEHVKRKEKTTKRRLALAVIDSGGLQGSITGVHAGHGHVTAKGITITGTSNSKSSYPDTPYAHDLVKRTKVAEKALRELKEQLQRIDVTGPLSWSFTQLAPDVAMDTLETRYKAALAICESQATS